MLIATNLGRGGGGHGGGHGGGGRGGGGRGMAPRGFGPRGPRPGPRHHRGWGRGRRNWGGGWYWGSGPLWLEEYAMYVCPVMDAKNNLVDYVLCPAPEVIAASSLPLSGLDDGLSDNLPLVLGGVAVAGVLYFMFRRSKKRRR